MHPPEYLPCQLIPGFGPPIPNSTKDPHMRFQRIAEKTLAQIAQTFLSPASQSTKSLTGFYGHFRSYLMRGSSCFQ